MTAPPTPLGPEKAPGTLALLREPVLGQEKVTLVSLRRVPVLVRVTPVQAQVPVQGQVLAQALVLAQGLAQVQPLQVLAQVL